VPDAGSAREKIILCRKRFAAFAIHPAKTLLGAHLADVDADTQTSELRFAGPQADACGTLQGSLRQSAYGKLAAGPPVGWAASDKTYEINRSPQHHQIA